MVSFARAGTIRRARNRGPIANSYGQSETEDQSEGLSKSGIGNSFRSVGRSGAGDSEEEVTNRNGLEAGYRPPPSCLSCLDGGLVRRFH